MDDLWLRKPIELKTLPDGTIQGTTQNSPKGYGAGVAVPVDRRPVLPVIFIPGIMGSNVRVKPSSQEQVNRRLRAQKAEETSEAWRPPNWKVSELGALYDAGTKVAKRSPAVREILLNPDTTEVDPEGFMSKDSHELLTKDEMRRRGWGGVLWDAYGEFLCDLNFALSRTLSPPKKLLGWGSDKRHELWDKLEKGEGAFGPFRLSEAELKKLQTYRMPVYAVGYNWLQSNRESAKRLKLRIDQILKEHGKQALGKVLLVTHSMGGLVARSFCQDHGDLVLGVVHGVQPAIGAAAAYYRLAAGMEETGTAAEIIGATGAENHPVMGFSPGPLELLPTKAYGPGWLKLEEVGPDGKVQEVASLPKEDPYAEIYLEKRAWCRMVDEAKLDPAKNHKDPWQDFKDALLIAKEFHEGLDYHKDTHAFYGDNGKLATITQVRWRYASKALATIRPAFRLGSPAEPPPPDPSQACLLKPFPAPVPPSLSSKSPLKTLDTFGGLPRLPQSKSQQVGLKEVQEAGVYKDDLKGGRKLLRIRSVEGLKDQEEVLEIPLSLIAMASAKDGPGDGTVPARSGAAPGKAGVRHVYRLELWEKVNADHPEKGKAHGHQDAFHNEQAQAVTLHALAKLAGGAP